jgi:hypothetical protein
VPSKVYWFFSALIELILIFFLSIFKLNKPSDSLSREDITDMRRGKPPTGHNGNDFRYKGSRSIHINNNRLNKGIYGRMRRWRMIVEDE